MRLYCLQSSNDLPSKDAVVNGSQQQKKERPAASSPPPPQPKEARASNKSPRPASPPSPPPPHDGSYTETYESGSRATGENVRSLGEEVRDKAQAQTGVCHIHIHTYTQ